MSELTRPRSNHNALYDPTLPGGGAVSRVTARFRSAASSAVKNSRSPSDSGRWRGVSDAYDHVPIRSGSPHGVRKSSPAGWPAAAPGHSNAAAAKTASAETVCLPIGNLLARQASPSGPARRPTNPAGAAPFNCEDSCCSLSSYTRGTVLRTACSDARKSLCSSGLASAATAPSALRPEA